MNKICIVLIFFCMQMAGMDSIAPDSRTLIFYYADLESKNYLALTSKQFLTSYQNFLQNISLNECIDGLYLFSSSEKKLAAWVNCNKKHQVSLINYKILKCSRDTVSFSHLQTQQYIKEKNEIISNENKRLCAIKDIIQKNKKEELKFWLPFNDTKIAINILRNEFDNVNNKKYIQLNLDDSLNQVLKNICCFFKRENSIEGFGTIADQVFGCKNNGKNRDKFQREIASGFEMPTQYDLKIYIDKALQDKNFSALVFILYHMNDPIAQDIAYIFENTVNKNDKKLLMQAGCRFMPVINELDKAIANENNELVQLLLDIIVDSGNCYLSYIPCLLDIIKQFELNYLIPKLFEQSYFSSTYFIKQKLGADQIHTIISTCYDHYGKDLWKDPRAQCFLDLALSDCNGQSFGKKIEFLLSKGIDIAFFRAPLLNDWSEYKNYCNNALYRIMCNVSEDIIIRLIQEKKQSINQALDVNFIQDLFCCAVIAQKWPIVSYLLPDLTIERIGCAPVDYATLLKQLVEHCPDQMLAFIKKHMTDGVFFRCGYRDFFAKILSSAIDLKQLDIVKFLLLHDKVNLLNDSSVVIPISNYLLDNALTEVIQNCKKWDHSASLLSRVKSRHLRNIVVSLQQDQLINIEQVFQWHEEGKFSNWRSEELINIVLNNQGLNDDKAKELLLNVINKRQLRFLEWLLKRKEINIVKHVPDRLVEILERCGKRNIVNHVAQANFTYDEYKEFLYRVGIRKTADVIFCMWWYSISNLKKALICCGSLATLASIIVGLCYKLTPVNLIV